MREFLQRLRERKLAQWALAYAAAAFALLQGVDIVAQRFGWPESIERGLIIALAVGFLVTIVLAWYHGERGVQRVSGTELLILTLLLALGGGALWRVARAPHAASEAATTPAGADANGVAAVAPDDKSIAVLPLANTSGDPSNEYFSDGLSEELISLLGKIPDLKITGRSSSFHFKDSKEEPRAIAARLGVAHLLEGSVRKQGERVRISVGLIKASDNRELWSETYDRELKDIFAVQSEIAAAVVAELKLKLLGAQPAPDAAAATVNLAAHNALLQGQFYLRRFSEADQRKAADYFEEAIRIDPSYALAHALLSRALRLVGASFSTAPAEIEQAYSRSRAAAKTALELDPKLSEAHLAMGFVLLTPDLDLEGAAAEFQRSLALTPQDSRAMQALGGLYAAQGKLDQSDLLSHRAIAADPFLINSYLVVARNQLARHELDAAEATLRQILALQPDASHCYAYLTVIDLERGDAAAALRDAAREPEGFWRDYATAMAAQAQGDRAAADRALAALIAKHGYGGPFQIAMIYAFRKEPDKVFEWLEKAYTVRDSGLIQLLVTPYLLDYRTDPRFIAVGRKLKIDEAVLARTAQ